MQNSELKASETELEDVRPPKDDQLIEGSKTRAGDLSRRPG